MFDVQSEIAERIKVNTKILNLATRFVVAEQCGQRGWKGRRLSGGWGLPELTLDRDMM